MHANVYQEWEKFSLKITKAKNIIEELSKLYIIIHQKVSEMMKKCLIDINYDVTKDAQTHLNFIKSILLRLSDRQKDQYLENVEKSLINKYQQQLFTLVDQIKITLITQKSKSNLAPTIENIMSIRKQKQNLENSLKEELKMSNERRMRSKSGNSANKMQLTHNIENIQSFPEKTNQIICDLNQYRKEYTKKKKQLEEAMKNQVIEKNHEVSFGNKYRNNNLEQYLDKRREFADLLFAQTYYDHILQKSTTNDVQITTKRQQDKNKKQTLQNKLFSEFKIKTKFMKEKVKQNILQTLVDVKKQLLKQFHQTNIQKLNQGNDRGLINLSLPKKKKVPDLKLEHASSLKVLKKQERQKSVSYRKTQYSTRYTIADKMNIPTLYTTNHWSKTIESNYNIKIAKRFQKSKIKEVL